LIKGLIPTRGSNAGDIMQQASSNRVLSQTGLPSVL